MTGPSIFELLLKSMAAERNNRLVTGHQELRDWVERWTGRAEFAAASRAVQAAAGRKSITDALVSTGVAGLLATTTAVDFAAVAQQLWTYLTRSEVKSLTAVAVDIDRGAVPADVGIGEWRVWAPSEADLASLAPVPLAAEHRFNDPWPVEVVTRHALLLREEEARAAGRLVLRFTTSQWALDAWLPLLALNTYSGQVVRAPALFDITAGERVIRHGDGVFADWEPVPGPPGEEKGEWLRLYTGPFRVRDKDTESFQRFCRLVAELWEQLAVPQAAELRERFQRAASQFVLASDESWPDGRAPVEVEVALRYVIALEGLLSSGSQELTRMVSERVAALCGDTPATAVRIRDSVRDIYAVRSRYVHGGEPRGTDLRAIRDVTRRVLVRWLAVAAEWVQRGATKPQTFNGFYGNLDDALLVPSVRTMFVTKPVERLLLRMRGHVA